MNNFCFISLLLFLNGCLSSSGPLGWTVQETVYLDPGFRTELSHNSPEAIRQELRDQELINLLGRSRGLTRAEVASVRIIERQAAKSLEIFQIGKSGKAFNVVSEQIKSYVMCRNDGHTKECILAALTNKTTQLPTDQNLKILAKEYPLLPTLWCRRGESSSTVEGSTPRLRWDTYILIDGEVAWTYEIYFKADGTFYHVSEMKSDAKEFDPKYKGVVNEVEKLVKQQMERDSISGQLGSCYTFWERKKKLLKERGITWRSPADLNPNVIYD